MFIALTITCTFDISVYIENRGVFGSQSENQILLTNCTFYNAVIFPERFFCIFPLNKHKKELTVT